MTVITERTQYTMPEHVPDLTDSEAPHLGKGQPPWGDLPYLSEMLHWFAVRDDPSPEIRDEIRNTTSNQERKVNQLFNLSRKLGLFSREEYRLLPSGHALTRVYDPPNQDTLTDGDTAATAVGLKSELAPAEQAVYQTVLFERDWVPMVATLHLIVTAEVSAKERHDRAAAYQDRVEHLEKYQDVNSPATWQAKLKPHLDWFVHLDLATEVNGEIQITSEGRQLYEQLTPYYPADW